MHISNLKIGTRLALGFALINLLLLACVAIGITMLGRLDDGTGTLVRESFPKAMRASAMMDDANDIAITLSDLHVLDAPAERARLFAAVAASRSQLDKDLTFLRGAVRSEQGKASLARVLAAHESFIGGVDNALQLLRGDDSVATEGYLLQQLRPRVAAFKEAILALVAHQVESMEKSAGAAHQDFLTSRAVLAVLAASAVLAGVVLGVLLTRSVTVPVARALAVAETVAAGDLGSVIESRRGDELGRLLRALKQMNDNLAHIVGEVRQGTDNIAAASQQIAAGNLDLSSRTEQQAGSLEETASSMEELTTAVRHNEDNARQARQLAAGAAAVAERGGQAVQDVVQTMQAIDASSRQIVDIIGVINGIAFQTNILALNAAVEAARAGEQGRGFAVVASEVRNLAQRAASAAKEIQGLIDTSVAKVADGSRLAAVAGQTMDEVVSSIGQVRDVVQEISQASAEQSAGIVQVNGAIGQMDSVTQQNASLVEQAAAAAAAMQDQAQRLTASVSSFKLGGAAVLRFPPAARPALPAPKRTVTAA